MYRNVHCEDVNMLIQEIHFFNWMAIVIYKTTIDISII
jgi:hypothetical protein